MEKLVIPNDISGGGGGFDVKVRPDFYTTEDIPRIIDAKYKNVNKFKNKIPEHSDIYQVVAYSRHCGVLGKFSDNATDSFRLSLAYPFLNSEPWAEDIKMDSNAFRSPINLYKIECPEK